MAGGLGALQPAKPIANSWHVKTRYLMMKRQGFSVLVEAT
jgi:hypothetical protein